jgi:hypothetical protein
MCDRDKLSSKNALEQLDETTVHVGAAKATTGFDPDGVGDLKPKVPVGLVAVTTDEAGNGIGMAPGNPTLTVGAPKTIGAINVNGDQDFYQVTLEAGKTYQIGMYGYTGPLGSPGPIGAPLADAFIEIRGATGTLITTADGGANTPANSVNSGFDVLLTFTPETSGTFYINARAFDNDPTDGTTGEGVGDYEIFVQAVDPNDPSVYRPYYDVDDPLYALDWGSQVDGTVRNPDGAESGHVTGNPQETPDNKGFDTGYHGGSTVGKNVISIYFAKAGDVFVSEDPTQPSLPPATVAAGAADFEIKAIWIALKEFEKVADVIFVETQDRASANFEYFTYKGTPGPGVSLLGSMSPPQERDEGLALFNSGDERWNATNLAQGGFSFVTLIHEFGHGMGMAHPHDNGGRSGVMRGVVANGPVADYTLGDFSLNQAVFTMMSYQDGWPESPHGNAKTNVGYGYLGGLMAFDIAVIQDKYGVNEEWATGNDTYTLSDVNEAGTFYYSIWDAGGTDQIVYGGSRNTTIDLRAATLQYEVGGGGRVSYASGIFGGFTVANGVVIENASSGSGNDLLIGNGAANTLNSGAGDDVINLSAGGDDTAIAGAGNDGIFFAAALTAADVVDGGEGRDQVGLQGDYGQGGTPFTFGAENLINIEQLVLLPGSDTRFGATGNETFSYNLKTVDENVAAGKELIVTFNTLREGENVTLDGSAESDGTFLTFGGKGIDQITGGQGNDGFFFGIDKRFGDDDAVDGQGGSDQLGLQGNYSGASKIVFGDAQLKNMEFVVALTGGDQRFGNNGVGYSYDLTTSDGNVDAGKTLIIQANTLRSDETLTFDGSAETNGRFDIFSGAGADTITGGAGNDTISGGRGADVLTGGDGADVFIYTSVADSTSVNFDKIVGFDYTVDKIDLPNVVDNFSVFVDASLSMGSFDADLAAALNGKLGPNQAAAIKVTGGDMVGRFFGVVDANGVAGYQTGEDYVVEFVNPVAPPEPTIDFLI